MAAPEAAAARRLRHWKALFSLFLQGGLAYRAQGLIWILVMCVAFRVMLRLGLRQYTGVGM